jgi:ligand-binding SRPBCC domain-containing protein
MHGIPIRWQSEIAVWHPPQHFVDRQTKGPYSLWVHEHTFEDHDGGTVIGDNVEYAVPGGSLVQKLLVAPDLERIFKYRHQILEGLFNPMKLKPVKQASA